jgi:uncharacterized protein YggT (Ycf19 family)
MKKEAITGEIIQTGVRTQHEHAYFLKSVKIQTADKTEKLKNVFVPDSLAVACGQRATFLVSRSFFNTVIFAIDQNDDIDAEIRDTAKGLFGYVLSESLLLGLGSLIGIISGLIFISLIINEFVSNEYALINEFVNPFTAVLLAIFLWPKVIAFLYRFPTKRSMRRFLKKYKKEKNAA